MNKKIILIFVIFVILLGVNGIYISASNNPEDKTTEKYQIELQEKNLLAKSTLKKANKYFIDRNFEQAADQYLKAISILSDLNKSQELEKKIEQIKDSLALTYSNWANELLQQAKSLSNENKLDEAKILIEQAKEINPSIKPEAIKLTKRLEMLQKELEFEKLSTDELTSKYTEKKNYNISVLYEQGKSLFRLNDLNKAKEKFEEILLLDPYNNKAIHYLDIINRKVYKTGASRLDQTSAERTGKVTWGNISPIVSKNINGNRIDIASNKPIKKEIDQSNVLEKLNKIVIPHISFEGVPVLDALMFLNDEAKKLDPEGKGVNFILKFEPERNPDTYTVDYIMDRVPIKKAIEDVCTKAGIYYKFDKFAVIISSTPIAGKNLITKVFPLEKEDFGTLLIMDSQSTNPAFDMKPYFTQRGVTFSEAEETAIYDFRINRLIVRSTPEQVQKIKEIVEKVNAEINPMISISSKFMEIDQTDFEELGFEWNVAFIGGHAEAPSDPTAPFLRFADDIGVVKNASSTGTPDREFGFTIMQDKNYVNGVLHALNQTGKTETLSSPKITTMNGCTTTIRVVEERYFPDSWTEPKIIQLASNNTNQQWVVSAIPNFAPPTDLGIIYRVTPFVGSDNYTIDLILEPLIQAFKGFNEEYTYYVSIPEMNTSDNNSSNNSNANNNTKSLFAFKRPMPIIASRSMKTRLRIYDGDTVVMGGALVDDTQVINDSIPIVGDIPLVGRFFQSEITHAIKTNLLIFTRVNLVMPDGTLLRPAKTGGQATFLDTF